MKQFSVFTFFTLLLISCQPELDLDLDKSLESRLIHSSENQSLIYYQFPSSSNLELIPQDPMNPLTVQKVELGKLLFHETAFAREGKFPITEGTYSCATCHHASAGFQAGLRQGLGEGGDGFGNSGE